MLVLAATAWKSNAEMIEAVHQLGYLKDSDHVLDPTYGRGTWWKNWQPKSLIRGLSDFRSMPFYNGEFDAIAFDPPYVSVGGRKTTTLGEYHNRYGMDDAPTSPAGVQEDINLGLRECHRVLKPKGILIVKCQDYISSGKFWNGTFFTQLYAIQTLGMTMIDRLEHIGSARPQPHATQVHARRNLSTLFVLRK